MQPQSSCNNTFKPKEINTKADKYCPLHNTNGHDAKECKVIFAQVKRMTSAYAAGGATIANCQKPEFQNKKTELMFSFMVKAFKKATNKSSATNQNNNKK